MRALHAEFHGLAADVLELALAGRKAEATAAMALRSRFAVVSSNLTMAVLAWKEAAAASDADHGRRRRSIMIEPTVLRCRPPPPEHPVTVLLVDDQAIIAEAVRRMLAAESDIQFHYCSDPTKAIELANQLAPTVILQDLVMPEIDGLTLVKFFRANPQTREVPMIVLSTKEEPIVKAQAFAVGANDYLVKLPDKLELIARIRYHSKGYIAQFERNEAYRKLAESQKQLADEVAQAAKYVCSLLPEPIDQGPVRVDWRFVPSTQLGGDSFGYHWLDDEHSPSTCST